MAKITRTEDMEANLYTTTRHGKNELPQGFKTWRYLLETVGKCFATTEAGTMPPTFFFDVHEKGEKHIYEYDADFIKARAFEELLPLVEEFEKQYYTAEIPGTNSPLIHLFFRKLNVIKGNF